MKKYILCLFIGLFYFTVSNAEIVCPQHLTPSEFNKKQKEFIALEAGLTQKESDAFFVVFFELQDKKRENSRHLWKLMRAANEELTEKEYDDTLTEIYQLKKANADLDLEYYQRFKNIISNKKIYDVVKAEAKFQREIIRGMHQKGKRFEKRKKQ